MLLFSPQHQNQCLSKMQVGLFILTENLIPLQIIHIRFNICFRFDASCEHELNRILAAAIKSEQCQRIIEIVKRESADQCTSFHRDFLGAHRYTTEGGISVRSLRTIAWSGMSDSVSHKGRCHMRRPRPRKERLLTLMLL